MDRIPNTNQHEAIAMILDSTPTPPILVIGPFGTGKTFILSLACVQILSQSERNKVLICTNSNSAADIHLQHLDTKIRKNPSFGIRPLRALNRFVEIKKIPESLQKYCLIEGIFELIYVHLFKHRTHKRYFPIYVFLSSIFNSLSVFDSRYRDTIRNIFCIGSFGK